MTNFFYLYLYRTLDILSSIDLTYESLDPTTLIYCDDDDSDHIWILLRSTSNTLQAWNQSECQLHGTICLNNLFEKIDKTNEQLARMEELNTSDSNDDGGMTNINDQIRITSFLIHDKQLWIGTSTGIILVFNYIFQRRSSIRTTSPIVVRSAPRSFSVTGHMIEHYLAPLPDLVNNRNKCRSRSDSAMIDLFHSSDDGFNHEFSSNRYLYRIAYPVKSKERSVHSTRRRKRTQSTITDVIIENRKGRDGDSGDTSTTLTSVRTRSSSPAVISTDEWCQQHRQIKFPSTTIKPQKSLEASATFSFNLVFKAKIADAPVKCICKTKYDTLIIF